MVDDLKIERVRDRSSWIAPRAAAAGFALSLVSGSLYVVTGANLALQAFLAPFVVAALALAASLASGGLLWARDAARPADGDGYSISDVDGDGRN